MIEIATVLLVMLALRRTPTPALRPLTRMPWWGWLGGVRLSGFMVVMMSLVVLAAFVLVPTFGNFVQQRQTIAALDIRRRILLSFEEAEREADPAVRVDRCVRLADQRATVRVGTNRVRGLGDGHARPPAPLAGCGSRCNSPPHHRTPAADDEGNCRTPRNSHGGRASRFEPPPCRRRLYGGALAGHFCYACPGGLRCAGSRRVRSSS